MTVQTTWKMLHFCYSNLAEADAMQLPTSWNGGDDLEAEVLKCFLPPQRKAPNKIAPPHKLWLKAYSPQRRVLLYTKSQTHPLELCRLLGAREHHKCNCTYWPSSLELELRQRSKSAIRASVCRSSQKYATVPTSGGLEEPPAKVTRITHLL